MVATNMWNKILPRSASSQFRLGPGCQGASRLGVAALFRYIDSAQDAAANQRPGPKGAAR